jgi:hypothetical protein
MVLINMRPRKSNCGKRKNKNPKKRLGKIVRKLWAMVENL